VSTITFLTSIVTIFCTIAGLIILWGVVKLSKWIALSFRAPKAGWEVYGGEEVRDERLWVRKAEPWDVWWRRIAGKTKEDEEVVVDEDESAERRTRRWWTDMKKRRQNGERRALLS
jgi:hypothetical protein